MDTGDDCYFFYNSSCSKGDSCLFRHVIEAKQTEVTCDQWRLGRCMQPKCRFRHSEQQPSYQRGLCYFESQPGGCTKLHCTFQHKLPRPGAPITSAPLLGAPVEIRPAWVPSRPPRPPGPHPAGLPVPWPGYRGPGPESLYHHAAPPNPDPRYNLDSSGDVAMLQVEPIIINPNEESDFEPSPVKRVESKTVPATKIDNPLDYFLNAKPYVVPSFQAPRPASRSPSPPRSPPYRKRSLSPADRRRRSTSLDRFDAGIRRRSGSLDRSRSPAEMRDRRRAVRRSRSPPPPRWRSRSPVRERLGRGRPLAVGAGRNFGPKDSQRPRLEEVRVSGRKIVSLRKDKQEGGEASKDEKSVEEGEAKPAVQTEADEEVKSLEEIYRERALLSMMEAKRKKVLENKRKRWEEVKGNKRQSESEKSDKSDKQSEDVDEKGDHSDKEEHSDKGRNSGKKDESTEDSSSDSEAGGSDIDFSADIDVEIAEGEIEPANSPADSSQASEAGDSASPARGKDSKKRSILSRLGVKADTSRQQEKNQVMSKRSIKDRLGLKSSVTESGDQRLRSGVIKLNKTSKSQHRDHRDVVKQSDSRKHILLLPQITIANKVEDRKTSIKQRLGLLDQDSDGDSRKRRKRDMDSELLRLIDLEGVDIEPDDLDLLSRKEKKRLLKKLLAQQGREDEYEMLTKKKKKRSSKKKRDRDEEERSHRRKINVADSGGEESEEADLESGDDIQLAEEEPLNEDSKENTEDAVEETEEAEETEPSPEEHSSSEPEVSVEETETVRLSKQAKLREALEPKSLDDIRRQRANRRLAGEDVRVLTGQNRRKIVIGDDEPPLETPEPVVRVTFNDSALSTCPRRKLTRLPTNPRIELTSASAQRGKRERQIYVPPSRKTEAPPAVTVKRSVGASGGRDIIDYSDMFPKKPATITVTSSTTSATAATGATISVKSRITAPQPPTAAEVAPKPRLKINKGPPKVEVKDATVKTFAEIMAEKKRKRLQAQKSAGKPVSSLLLDDTEGSNSRDSLVDTTDTPVPIVSIASASATTSPLKRDLSSSQLGRTDSSDSLNLNSSESKPTRWKRRKTSEQKNIAQDSTANAESSKTTSVKPDVKPGVHVTKTIESGGLGKENIKGQDTADVQTNVKVKQSPVAKVEAPLESTRRKSAGNDKPSSSSEADKLGDSFLDFDDELLSLEDGDLDLDSNQDHDQLMREIDELLN